MSNKRIIILIAGLQHSALRLDYKNINQKVEKWSKIIVLITMIVVYPSVMFSKFVISFLLYFTMDMGEDAFELPFPYW